MRAASGCRDVAILTLLVRLGLRAGEVAALALDDIDWRAGVFVVRGKGNRTERLPLPADSARRLSTTCAGAARRAPRAGPCSCGSRLPIEP